MPKNLLGAIFGKDDEDEPRKQSSDGATESSSTPEDRRARRNKKADDADVDVPHQRTDVEFQNRIRDRSIGWIVGTSLLFEAMVLGLAAWIFNRRDF